MLRFASAALKTALSLLLFLLLPVLAAKAETKVLINEFLSINNGIIQD
jgi:hypothetical protein